MIIIKNAKARFGQASENGEREAGQREQRKKADEEGYRQ
jgi:hypothetical protein